jgi:hypothetical protein
MFATDKEASNTAIDTIEVNDIAVRPLSNNTLSNDTDATSDKSHTLSASTINKV